MSVYRSWITALIAVLLGISTFNSLFAGAIGGFAVVLDQADSQGDSRRSLVFYDTDDFSMPMFGVFLGTEATTSASGSVYEDPESITVNPDTGDVYVLAFDSGSTTEPVSTEPDGDLDGRGDYDLLRVNFQAAYAHWEANFKPTNTYVTYGDGTSLFDASHTNPQAVPPAPAVVDKIGEIGRSPGTGVLGSFASHLEFVSPTRLAYIDSQTAESIPEGTPQPPNTMDVQIRVIDRVSSSPGAALPAAGGTEGGFNNNTSESWESKLLNHVKLDGRFSSDVISIGAVRNRDGVTGLWIMEDDPKGTVANPGGEELAFFDFATNDYRTIDLTGSPNTRFRIDDAPPTNDNLGEGDKMLVDPLTGNLVIVEDSFSDTPQQEPGVYKIQIPTYDTGPDDRIGPPNSTSKQLLDPTSYNDGTSLIDGRNAIFDWINNAVYFLDEDNNSDTLNGGVAFAHDWYRLDLGTGLTTVVGKNADLNGLFDVSGRGNDQVEFFNIAVPEPGTVLMLFLAMAVSSACAGRRRRN